VWWKQNPLRCIQTNLRVVDANIDPKRLVDRALSLGANVLMINAGGIAAFYPTHLDCPLRAPGQQQDLLGEVLRYAKPQGLRMIARFDFSKTDKCFWEAHRDWFYLDRTGHPIAYHGLFHTCPSRLYQSQSALAILQEVLQSYPVDGVFFNMFDYQTRDYSGLVHGECYCEQCVQGFLEQFGRPYPGSLHELDAFKNTRATQLLRDVRRLVKGHSEEIAISTYHEDEVDIVRKESNTEMGRTPWLCSTSDNVQSLEDSWPDKIVSNVSINALAIRHRFAAVSPHETAIRLYQSLGSGSGLDFCIVGPFDGYPDSRYRSIVSQIFHWHRDHQALYGHLTSLARIALIQPRSGALDEYQGFFRVLKEEHVLFDVMAADAPQLERLGGYRLIIAPSLDRIRPCLGQAIEHALSGGSRLFMTGTPPLSNPSVAAFWSECLGIQIANSVDADAAFYALPQPTSVFQRLLAHDCLVPDNPVAPMSLSEDGFFLLPVAKADVFGPPERASAPQVTAQMGAAILSHGMGRAAYVPWQPARLYLTSGSRDYHAMIMDLLDHLIDEPHPVRTDAPSALELFFHRLSPKRYLLRLRNPSGFNGTTYEPPMRLTAFTVTLNLSGRVESVTNLTSDCPAPFVADNLTFSLPITTLKDNAVYVIKTV